jgi:hypothetical protein
MKRDSQFSSLKLVRPNRLAREIVFCDGVGSSGKGMLSHLISSFSRVEKQSNHYAFDYVSYLHWFGKMSDDAATTYLQTEADFQLYHIMMSRDVNFRPRDSTGVMRNAFRFRYFKRLFLKEGDAVLERILAEKPILNEAPHDALRSAPLFFNAFGDDLNIVYILRDPCELVFDWHRRGFAHRIGSDTREFQFSFSKNDKIVPIFLADYDFVDSDLNDYERLVLMIHFCFFHNLRGMLDLDDRFKKNVYILEFDDLIRFPMAQLEKIANHLGTLTTKSTSRMIKQEGLPRESTNKNALYESLIEKISPEIRVFLDQAISDYQRLAERKNAS